MSDDDLDRQLELARLRAQEREFVEREKREEEFGLLLGAGLAAAAWAHDQAQPEPEPRGTTKPMEPSAEEVRAERARRSANAEPIGYDALARHFHVSTTTIRRRLEKL